MGGAGLAPWLGRVSSRGRAATGKDRGSAATCFPARSGCTFPLLLLCIGLWPPPDSGVDCVGEVPSSSLPRPQGAPGFGLLRGQSRSPGDRGRWVGGAWEGNPSRDRLVRGQVPVQSAMPLGVPATPSSALPSWWVLGTPGAPPALCGSALPGSSPHQS